MTGRRSFAVLLLGAATAAFLPAQEAEVDIDVDEAIDAGADFLLQTVEGKGGWIPDNDLKFGTGFVALQVYALVKSDVSYQSPIVQKGIATLEAYTFEKVYSVSLYLMAYDAMVEQIDADVKMGEARPGADRATFLERMDKALQWLLNARLKGVGGWTYEAVPPRENPRTHRWDHSNTQFAVLALGVAAERKLKVPVEVWEEIADHFISTQDEKGEEVKGRPVFRAGASGQAADPGRGPRPREKDAPVESGKTVARKASPLYGDEKVVTMARGWEYSNKESGRANDPRFSMFCSGISSLLLAEKNLPAAFKVGSRGEAIHRAIRDGYAGFIKNFEEGRPPGVDPYGYYSLEKVGDLGEVVSFGGYHWYQKVAKILISGQRRNGAWGPSSDESTERWHTALALLTLDRATDLSARNRPLARITRVGGGGPAGADQGLWVYLPSLKGEVPVGRLFRLFKNRPGKQVMKLIEEAVKVYDPNRMSDLVRPLLSAMRGSRFQPSRDLAAKLLTRATGLSGADPKAYEEWASRWEEVARIGRDSDASAIDKLRGWLTSPQSGVFKVKVIWALQRTKAVEAAGDLIECLEDKDPAVREAAYQALTFLTDQSIPFHVKGTEKARADEVKAWKKWYATDGKALHHPEKPPEKEAEKDKDSEKDSETDVKPEGESAEKPAGE